jgi:hypothetical protein
METKNTIAVIVSYVPATNSKGSRVKIEIPRMNIRKFFSYDSFFNSSSDQVECWLIGMGATPLFQAELKKHQHMFAIDFLHWDKLEFAFGKR